MKSLFKWIANIPKRIDLFLLTLCLASSLYGLILIYSATTSYGDRRYILIQGACIIIGTIGYIIISFVDMDDIASWWPLLLAFGILFIGSLHFFGVAGDTGNKAWLRFGPVGIQPAEVVKLSFIIILAKQMASAREKVSTIKNVSLYTSHLLLMMGIIVVVSSDVGSALVYLLIFLCMAMAAGVKLYWFLIFFGGVIAAAPFLWNNILREDQKLRILVVIDKNLDPLGKGYHANRAKVAFQNGGFFGQGLLNGKTVQGETLPAKHTDFIFAACGEELGFIGCALIIVLLSLIIFRCFYVALHAKNKMGSIICAGICGMMMFQTIENILMCLGLFPVIGLTLPLFSYGGTSVITTFAAMGIVSSIKMRPMPEWYKNSMSKYNTYSSEVTK